MGDPDDGFVDFVVRRQRQLVRLGWALTGDRQLGEDLAQVAVQRLWPRWSRVSATGDPYGYAQRIVVNLWSTTRRTNRRRADLLAAAEPFGSGAEDPAEAVAGDAAVEWWLDHLPPRQRAVVVLRVLFDCSVSETAARLGCSEGTVKSQTAKALRTLREALTPSHEETGVPDDR